MDISRYCLFCKSEFEGRIDKKFCDQYCKSSYHYRRRQTGSGSFYSRVDRQLKINRRILKNFNTIGKTTVTSIELKEQGFNPNFFTHYWKNKRGDVYLFVYEFGFLSKRENGVKWNFLIKWQDYMNRLEL